MTDIEFMESLVKIAGIGLIVILLIFFIGLWIEYRLSEKRDKILHEIMSEKCEKCENCKRKDYCHMKGFAKSDCPLFEEQVDDKWTN